MSEFVPLYEISSEKEQLRLVLASVAGLVALFGGYFLIGAPRREAGRWNFLNNRQPSSRHRKHAAFNGALALFVGAGMSILLIGVQRMDNRLIAQYRNGDYQVLVGRVDAAERNTPVIHATRYGRSQIYWYYTSISVNGKVFRMGTGSGNPGLKHYVYGNPPVREGDYVRVKYIGGAIVSFERRKA